MAVVYPLSLPIEDLSETEIEAVDIASLQVASFTGQERVQQFSGDYWKVTIRYRNLGQQLGRQMAGFVYALRGPIGTFVMKFPGYGSSLGAAAGIPSSPLVNGSGQAGSRVLNIKSAPASVLSWLKAGDIIQVGPDTRPHWHAVLNDVDTSASGTASIDIWPAVRNTTVNNDLIVIDEPRCLVRLTESPKIPIRHPILYDVTLECRESVP